MGPITKKSWRSEWEFLFCFDYVALLSEVIWLFELTYQAIFDRGIVPCSLVWVYFAWFLDVMLLGKELDRLIFVD